MLRKLTDLQQIERQAERLLALGKGNYGRKFRRFLMQVGTLNVTAKDLPTSPYWEPGYWTDRRRVNRLKHAASILEHLPEAKLTGGKGKPYTLSFAADAKVGFSSLQGMRRTVCNLREFLLMI